MSDPVSAFVVVAAIVSAASAAYSGYQQQRAASYNAKVANQAADAAIARAKYDEQMHRERVRKILSSTRAQYGAAGVSMEGSALLAIEETARQGSLDALAIRYGGDVEAARMRSEAYLSRMQGRSAMTSGMIGAGTSLLGGASGYYNRQTQLQKQPQKQPKSPTVMSA
jgi:hypothetical protein